MIHQNHLSATPRVGILGAGVIGLSLAWELAQRGVTVRLLDRGLAGRGTSWAAAGILPAAKSSTALDPMDRLRGVSHELYPRWCESLTEASSVDCGFRRCGGLYLASRPGEAAALAAWVGYQQQLGIESERLTREQLGTMAAALNEWAQSGLFHAAVWSPQECQVRPPDLLRALKIACQRSGVDLVEHSEPGAFLTGQNHIKGLEDCDCTVICGGVWAGQLMDRYGLATSLIPIRGQMLLYPLDQPPMQAVVNDGNRYVVPRDDGRLLVGSCEEEVGFAAGTTAEILGPLRRWAESVLPRLVDVEPERCWSGLRPATFDGFPMLGRVPDTDRLYFAGGHYRSGIHLAPATALVMAELILGQSPTVDISAFSVGRLVNHSLHTVD